MTALLEGKVCVITGGAGSIGMATARLFGEHGARMLLVDRDVGGLADAASRLDAADVAHCAADVTSETDVAAYVAAATSRWGRIDVLVSNAGTSGSILPVTEYPVDVFDAVYAVHVRGAFLACKHALPVMAEGGSVVITSSVAGLRGDPGVSAYIAAKHAQVGLMRSVAKEAAARRIRVNTIHPGPVANDFQAALEEPLSDVVGANATELFDSSIPLGRHATSAEIARSLLYLASDQSSFTTGSTLVADGGMSV